MTDPAIRINVRVSPLIISVLGNREATNTRLTDAVRSLYNIADQLRELRKQDEETYTSESLSPGQKRERLDHITAQKNDLYRKVQPIERDLEAQR